MKFEQGNLMSDKKKVPAQKSRQSAIALNPYWLLAARVLLAIIFVVSGFKQIGNFKLMVYNLEQHHVPLAGLAMMFAILMEIGGGLFLMLGYRTRQAAQVLVVFLVLANVIFNLDFSDALRQMQFLKDLAILGGLLLIMQTGGGRFSLEQWFARDTE
jgi:putative oxidoreductase